MIYVWDKQFFIKVVWIESIRMYIILFRLSKSDVNVFSLKTYSFVNVRSTSSGMWHLFFLSFGMNIFSLNKLSFTKNDLRVRLSIPIWFNSIHQDSQVIYEKWKKYDWFIYRLACKRKRKEKKNIFIMLIHYQNFLNLLSYCWMYQYHSKYWNLF